jgi:adenine phosphoribosyltransferase
MELSNYIDTIPDFPRDGVAFKDITPLLRDQTAYSFALDRGVMSLNATPSRGKSGIVSM